MGAVTYWYFVCSACNPLAKDLSIKEMLNFRGNEGFEGCLENVLCVLEGKGSKIKLKSEQKKLIRQLYEIGITF